MLQPVRTLSQSTNASRDSIGGQPQGPDVPKDPLLAEKWAQTFFRWQVISKPMRQNLQSMNTWLSSQLFRSRQCLPLNFYVVTFLPYFTLFFFFIMEPLVGTFYTVGLSSQFFMGQVKATEARVIELDERVIDEKNELCKSETRASKVEEEFRRQKECADALSKNIVCSMIKLDKTHNYMALMH